MLGFSFVTDIVPLVVEYDALATNVDLTIFAEEFGLFVWVL